MKIAIWDLLYAILPRSFLSQPNINFEVDRCALLHVKLFIATKFYFSVFIKYVRYLCQQCANRYLAYVVYSFLWGGCFTGGEN